MVGNDQLGPQKNLSETVDGQPTVRDMVESIIGCKWSLSVLTAIRNKVCRPGEIEKLCNGMSSKVLYERLRKLERFGLIERQIHEVIPPHVEYHFTEDGKRFLAILDVIDQVQKDWDA
jgi:DNA-binding HxlR family transcriptional regulator